VSNTQMWEYRVDPLPGELEQIWPNLEPTYEMSIKKKNAEILQRALNQRGEEGWELVAVGSMNVYYRRPK
jgi:hypothetical protein